MSVEMRKIDRVWVRPEAVESIAEYADGGAGDQSLIHMACGAQHLVRMSADEIVAKLAADPIYSWGQTEPIRG